MKGRLPSSELHLDHGMVHAALAVVTDDEKSRAIHVPRIACGIHYLLHSVVKEGCRVYARNGIKTISVLSTVQREQVQ